MLRKKFTKVLVPLDGTKSSKIVLEMAISVARQFGSTVTGVYVINTQAHSEFVGTKDMDKSAMTKIKKSMEDAKVLAAQNGIDFSYKILKGDAGYNIIKLAHDKKHNYNIIVMGTHGKKGIRKMFMGSVSNYVVQTSKIPVLLVK